MRTSYKNRAGEIHIINQDITTKQESYEVVERKGIGHPDTLCDILASELSRAYSLFTIAHCDGLILHHQFDKVMIIGGKTEVTFGEIGHFTEPIQLIIAGRVSTHYKNQKLPIKELLNETIMKYMDANFLIPDIEQDLVIYHMWTSAPGPGTIKESEGAIAEMFTPSSPNSVRGYGAHYVSNDTSYGAAYAPKSKLEKAILDTENQLNSIEIKRQYPWMGTDIKIMGVRIKNRVHVTACIPQIARFVSDINCYKENLKTCRFLLFSMVSKCFDNEKVEISLNTKDNFLDKNVYLTVTGGSLSGDIGVTGRGNRINGLITANRPMSLDGAAGKNPRYYAGIIYNLAARYVSDELHSKTLNPNEVVIISQNGLPLLFPRHVIVVTSSTDNKFTLKIVKECLKNIPQLTDLYLSGALQLC